MSIRIDLKQFKREYEAAHRRSVTWTQIREGTGISDATLNRMMNEKAQRVDLDVLDRLCAFFGVSQGPVPFIIYEPDGDKVPAG